MFEGGAGEEGAEAGGEGMPPDEGEDEQDASAAAVKLLPEHVVAALKATGQVRALPRSVRSGALSFRASSGFRPARRGPRAGGPAHPKGPSRFGGSG